jgi:hypothetical protein
MKVTLSDGNLLTLPDGMSDKDIEQQIDAIEAQLGKGTPQKSNFAGQALTGAQQLLTYPARTALGASQLAYQGAGGLLDMLGGDQAAEWMRGQARTTAGLSDTLKTPASGVDIPEWQKQTIDALAPAAGAGYLATKGIGALQGLGDPAMKLAVKAAGRQPGRASAVASAAGEVIATPATIAVLGQIDDSDMSPATKKILKATVPLVMGVGVGVTFENVLDHAFKNTLLTGRMLREVTKARNIVKMEKGSDIANKVGGYDQKLNKGDDPVPKTSQEIFGDDDIPDFGAPPTKTTKEKIGTPPDPDYDDYYVQLGMRVRPEDDYFHNPTPVEILRNRAKPLVEEEMIPGQIAKEANAKPTAGALGDNREKLAITPVGDKHLVSGRFGAGRLENGEWRLYEKQGDEYGWVGRVQDRDIAGNVLAMANELSLAGEKVNLKKLTRTYANAEKQAIKSRAKGSNVLAKEIKRQISVGEDNISVDMIEVAEPLLKGVFGKRKTVTSQDIREILQLAWRKYSLVKDGQVTSPENYRKLFRLNKMMDIVQGRSVRRVGAEGGSDTVWTRGVRGNEENINKEISRAVRDGDISVEQAGIIRAINSVTTHPLNFGMTIAKREKGEERASYTMAYPWMKLDPTRDGPYVYAHEFSHWGWWEILSSNDRLIAAKEIADLIKTGGIKSALPLSETAPKILASEMEIFAEMSSQFIVNNKLPEYMSKGVMKAIARVAKAVKRVARRMGMDRKVSPELERLFRKIADAPNPKLQPDTMDSVYLDKGVLSDLSPDEAIKELNNFGFVQPKIDEETGQAIGMELADIEKMTPQDRMLFGEWVQKVGDHGLFPDVFGSVDEMLATGEQALKPLINPMMREHLDEELGEDAARWLVNQANEIAGKISQRVAKDGELPPLQKGPTEAATDVMKDYYSGNQNLDQPWWMGSVMQAKIAPTVMAGMVGGIEWDREDGVEIPFLGGRKIGWNPWKSLAFATIVGGAGGKTGLFGPLIAKHSKGAAEKLWAKVQKDMPVLHEIAVSIHPQMRVKKDIYDSLSDYLRIRPALEDRFNEMITKLKNTYTHDELTFISDIIEQEGPDWMSHPQILHDQAAEIVPWLKDIGDGLISAGFPEKEVRRIGETWLPRAYGPKMIMKRPITAVETTWRSLYGDFLFRRGLPKTFGWRDPAIKDVITHVGTKGLKPDDKIHQFNLLVSDEGPIFVHQSQRQQLAKMRNLSEYHESHVWEIERWSPNKNITLRRDYNRLERKMMGEKRNLAFRLSKFVRDAAHDTALGHAYKRISENTDHVVDVEKIVDETEQANKVANLLAEGWWKVPPTKIAGTEVGKFGMLTGKWVSPDASRIVKAMASQRYQSKITQAAHSIISRSTRMWKIGKTAFNPKTHGFNWLNNVHMCLLHGYEPFTTIGSGGRSLAAKDEWVTRATDAGMLDSNVLRGEYDLGNFLREIEAIERGQVIDESMGLLRTMANFGKRQGKKKIHAALKTYELGDKIFKLGIFKKEIRRGATDAEAMAKANELFFDYRDIPPGIAFLRDWGLFPFVSYTYKMIPTVLKSVRDYPHRALGILWLYNMLNEVMYSADYGDRAKEQQEYERASLPEHMKKSTIYPAGPWGNIRMSKKMLKGMGLGANEGQAPFMDVSHGSMPGGDMFSEGGIMGAYPFSFHPAISLLGTAVSGRDMGFNKDIVNQDPVTGQDKIDNWAAYGKYAIRTLSPNLPFIPGQYSWERMGNAITGTGVVPPSVADTLGWTGKDAFGGDISLTKEVFNMFGVLNSRDPYPPKEFVFEKKRKRRSVRDAKLKHKYGVKDKRNSPSEIRKLKQNARDTRDVQVDALAELNRLRDAAPDPDLLKYSR